MAASASPVKMLMFREFGGACAAGFSAATVWVLDPVSVSNLAMAAPISPEKMLCIIAGAGVCGVGFSSAAGVVNAWLHFGHVTFFPAGTGAGERSTAMQ